MFGNLDLQARKILYDSAALLLVKELLQAGTADAVVAADVFDRQVLIDVAGKIRGYLLKSLSAVQPRVRGGRRRNALVFGRVILPSENTKKEKLKGNLNELLTSKRCILIAAEIRYIWVVQGRVKGLSRFGDNRTEQRFFLFRYPKDAVFKKAHARGGTVEGDNDDVRCALVDGFYGVEFVGLVKDDIAAAKLVFLGVCGGLDSAGVHEEKFPEVVGFSLEHKVRNIFKIVDGVNICDAEFLFEDDTLKILLHRIPFCHGGLQSSTE